VNFRTAASGGLNLRALSFHIIKHSAYPRPSPAHPSLPLLPPPPPPQVAAWEPTLQKIAGWFDQLLAVDVEGVPPATDAGVGGGSLRADKVDVSLAGADEALGQAPELEGGFVRVPKVV